MTPEIFIIVDFTWSTYNFPTWEILHRHPQVDQLNKPQPVRKKRLLKLNMS